jgi:hypothetical protein
VTVLGTLNKDSGGEWTSLADYLREARHRETGALAALVTLLTAPPEEQKELAQGEGASVLLDLGRDLRVPKASRLAAARCLLEAGATAALLGELFIGAGDLVTDPRLGSGVRKLVEAGLPAALKAGGEIAQVSLAAGSFARSVHSAASAVGQTRAKELLTAAPEGHAGAAAGLFAMGQGELPPPQLEAWQKLLESTCAAHRRAPAAARRMGLTPPWPPNLPEAFASLVREAEKKNAGVVSEDAAANPNFVRQPKAVPAPPPLLPKPSQLATAPKSTAEVVGRKKLEAPIRRSPFRKPIGSVVELPTQLPAKPMAPVTARAGPTALPRPPQEKPHLEDEDEAKARKMAPLPGIVPLASKEANEIRFDPKGRKIARSDRWDDNHFEWELPTLPTSDLPPPLKAAVAQGPFAQRLQSLCDNRPEAVDRLVAAAEARAAVVGEEKLLAELSSELGRKRWQNARVPGEQLDRLRGIEKDHKHPAPWRAVARLLLDRLGQI